jgi:hypothetical protein
VAAGIRLPDLLVDYVERELDRGPDGRRELRMVGNNGRLLLGALTGLVSLVAMVRLVSGAFPGPLSAFSWVFLLLAMIPWVGYTAWRARHSRLLRRSGLVVLGLSVVGLLVVWFSTVGAVLALACSFAAFVVIWVHDWPERRAGEDQFVRIEDLGTDDRD